MVGPKLSTFNRIYNRIYNTTEGLLNIQPCCKMAATSKYWLDYVYLVYFAMQPPMIMRKYRLWLFLLFVSVFQCGEKRDWRTATGSMKGFTSFALSNAVLGE